MDIQDTCGIHQGIDDYWIIPSVCDHMLNPAECLVQRDISPILYCLNAEMYVNTLHCVVVIMKIYLL